MHLTITRTALLPPLADAVGAVEKRQTLPILANVLLRLDATAETLILTGTDLETEIIARAPIETGGPDAAAAITVPAHRFKDLVQCLPEDARLSLTLRDDKPQIKAGSARFSLSTLPADGFPAFDRAGLEAASPFPADLLRSALATTAHAMALQDVRYYLNGLCLYVAADRLHAIASDGHRLAHWEAAIPDYADTPQIIIPRKAVELLRRRLADADTAALAIGNKTLRLDLDEQSIATKLIEGRYPDYQRVWPRDIAYRYTVDRETLLAACRRIGQVSNEKYKPLTFETAGADITLKARTPEQHEGEDTVPILECTSRETISTGFNATYLIDALDTLPGEHVTLSFPERQNACLIESPDLPEAGIIVMPMRI